ncbi:MAG: DUF4129 domain-containing protein [Proteobacteria bacterium]|nr:DUF4129 domain-containing protein [Pseudomonadota bacterium]MBI3499362.1 DUF4129 domain-containing protein [Pseudomonadota bacterium]
MTGAPSPLNRASPSPSDFVPGLAEVAFSGVPGGRGRIATRSAVLAGVGFLLALAGLVPPNAGSWIELEAVGWSRHLPDWAVLSAIGALAVVFALILIASTRARPRPKQDNEPEPEQEPPTPEIRRSFLIILVAAGVIAAAMLWLLQWVGPPGTVSVRFEPAPPLSPPDPNAGGQNFAPLPPPEPWPLLDWILAIAAMTWGMAIPLGGLLMLVGAVVLAIRWLRKKLAKPPAPAGAAAEPGPSQLALAVEESLDELRHLADPRAAIIKCYARFERLLADRKAGRAASATPAEFMTSAIALLPLAPEPIRHLTRLFELARFSNRPLAQPEQEAALQSLIAIKTSLDASRSDSPQA